ncbi:hypothetical protein [Microvirgula aerodenitrificans]|nr:hypothetical protein [Microvirgula aerodenitrificans]
MPKPSSVSVWLKPRVLLLLVTLLLTGSWLVESMACPVGDGDQA